MSRWDGSTKYITKDCSECQFYRRLIDGKHEIEVCGWGVAYKFLVTKDNPRKCDLPLREPPEHRSVESIDEVSIILKCRRNRAKEERNRYYQLKLFQY